MKAAVFEGKGKLTIKDVPEPKLEDKKIPKKYGPGFISLKSQDLVKLKVLAASICGTDLQILKVPPGHGATRGAVLGHEYVGQVVEQGANVTNVKKGDRVVVNPNITCGTCWFCRNGLSNMCREMSTLGIFTDGGFAEYNVAPARQLFPIPEDLESDIAIFFEPLTCATHSWEKLSPKVGGSLLIFGAGPMGCYFVELARISGLGPIIVSEPSAFRRKFAKILGATRIVDPTSQNLGSIVKNLTGYGVDIAIDASGVPEVIKEAMDLVRPGGKISTFGQQNVNAFADKVSFTKVTQKELQIIGSYATSASFDQTIKILTRPDLNLKKLITHRLPLSQIKKGIDLMRKGKAIEIIIYPSK